jgi:hypothetical protein
MWTAPVGKRFFDVSNGLVGCGHMSGLFARRFLAAGPDEVRQPRSLIIAASFTLMTIRGLSSAVGCGHVVHHVSLRSPNS